MKPFILILLLIITTTLYGASIPYKVSLSSNELSSVSSVLDIDKVQRLKGHIHFDLDKNFSLIEYQRTDYPIKFMAGSLVNYTFDNKIIENTYLENPGLYLKGSVDSLTAKIMVYPFLLQNAHMYYGSLWHNDRIGIGFLHESFDSNPTSNANERSTISLSAKYQPEFIGFSSGAFRLFNLFFDQTEPVSLESDIYFSHTKAQQESLDTTSISYKLSLTLPYQTTTYKQSLSFQYIYWNQENSLTYNTSGLHYEYPYFQQINDFRNTSKSYTRLKFNATKSFYPISITAHASYIPKDKLHFGRVAVRYQRFSKYGIEMSLSKSSFEKFFHASIRFIALNEINH